MGLIFPLATKYAMNYKQLPQNTADSGRIRLGIVKMLDQKAGRRYREDLQLGIKSGGALAIWDITERHQTPFGLHERTIPTHRYWISFLCLGI